MSGRGRAAPAGDPRPVAGRGGVALARAVDGSRAVLFRAGLVFCLQWSDALGRFGLLRVLRARDGHEVDRLVVGPPGLDASPAEVYRAVCCYVADAATDWASESPTDRRRGHRRT
jgi:hypothetical protein